VYAVNWTAVYRLLDTGLARTAGVVDLGDSVIVQAKDLGNDTGAQTASNAGILIDEYLTYHKKSSSVD
jgi:hypothetical protein